VSPPELAPLAAFNDLEIKYRYGESYIGEATNTAFLGTPRGVYLGFVPTLENFVLTLSPDPDYGVSALRATSLLDPLRSADIFFKEDIVLDFTGHVGGFPIYVYAEIDQVLGAAPNVARILTAGGLPSGPTQILICTLPDAVTVSFDDPTNRATPYAHASAPLGFGFMKDSALPQLLEALDLVLEVQAAREDLTGTIQPDLSSRLAADGAGQAMADRLAKSIRTVQSLDFVTTGGTSENVSESFGNRARIVNTLDPQLTIAPFGGEELVGAICDGTLPDVVPAGAVSDGDRNVCVLVDSTTGARIMDGVDPVFARLICDEVVLPLAWGLDFTIASTTVNGTTTDFTDGTVVVGDIIEDNLSNFYRVDSIGGALVLDLDVSTPAVATSSANEKLRRRFTLEFFKSDGVGGEQAVSLAAALNVRFYFPQWQDDGTGFYDAWPTLHQHGESEPVPVATAAIEGRARLAIDTALGGALYNAQDNFSPVSTTRNWHTIDWMNAGAALSPSPGVLDVNQRGPDGDPGPTGGGPGSPPAPGLQGDPGVGITERQLFLKSPDADHLALGPGATYSWQGGGGFGGSNFLGFTNEVIFATGGLAASEHNAPLVDPNDHFIIEDISFLGIDQVEMDMRVPSGGSPVGIFAFFINAGGY